MARETRQIDLITGRLLHLAGGSVLRLTDEDIRMLQEAFPVESSPGAVREATRVIRQSKAFRAAAAFGVPEGAYEECATKIAQDLAAAGRLRGEE